MFDMSSNHEFPEETPAQVALTLQALEELTPEIQAAQKSPLPAMPTLKQVLDEVTPLPRQALFLGVASDGLPVLLSLADASPGPLLVIGDQGCGKTAFLQAVARAAAFIHDPKDVQFGAITNYPDEWEGFGELPNCVGIFPACQGAAVDFLLNLVNWAHGNRGGRQSTLLLVDELESITQADFDPRQNLRWLLLRGPTRRVWPLVTLNPKRYQAVQPWPEAFRTRVFGHVAQAKIADELTAAPGANLANLLAGAQFTLREGSGWLRFWIPRLDEN